MQSKPATANRADEPSASKDYFYPSADASHTHAYLWGPVVAELERSQSRSANTLRVFDLGCGNGAFMAHLHKLGFDVTGCDPSTSGVEYAQSRWDEQKVYVGSAYDDLAAKFGQFAAVVSLEVVEHVYDPREYAKTLYSLVEPGGVAIISTPYHGYIKNLAMAVTGKIDAHFTALWDHGHIKFWSVKTLRILLQEAGFSSIRFLRVGRFPALAKSMIAIATSPLEATTP